jgi:hypothetical protein
MSNNNSDQLLAYPITKELDYRSQINSKELNEMIRSIEESVLRSLLRGTKLQEDLTRFNLAVDCSYKAMYKQFNNMKYPQDYLTNGTAFCSAFGDVVEPNTTNKNEVAGILTLGWNTNNGKLSKIPVYEGVVSPNILIYLDDIVQPISDPIYNILDKDPSTFWVKEASSGEHTIEIVLPNSINKTFNYLEIVPFPIFGMIINKIEYLDLQSRMIEVPNDVLMSYNNIGPMYLHLSPKEFNNTIKITFTVLPEICAMGFSSIDICNIDYFNNPSTAYFKFENIITEYNGVSVTEIKPTKVILDFYADGVLNKDYDKFITEVSLVTSASDTPTRTFGLNKERYQEIDTSETIILENTGELYLKVILNEVNKTTPVFRGAKLTYDV